jgi:hypothetical protein
MEKTQTVKTVVQLFGLPQKLGVLQYVEFTRSEYTSVYAGVIKVEGCKRGVCIKYKAEVVSKDGRRWILPKRRREDKEEEDGELKQQIFDALWEMAERGYDIEIQYKCYEDECGRAFCIKRRRCYRTFTINGIEPQLYEDCRTAEECVDVILRAYKLAKEPPPPPPEEVEAERLLKEWPELEVWGLKWIKSWIYAKKRLVAIAELMQSHQWIKNMIAERKDDLSPFDIRAYVSKDKAEVCVSLKPFEEIYCSSDGTIRKIELERKGWDESGTREVYRLKGLLAFAKNAKEYVEIL